MLSLMEIRDLCESRFDIELQPLQAIDLWYRYQWVAAFIEEMGGDPLPWLKNRLLEAKILTHGPGEYAIPDRYVCCRLHMFEIFGPTAQLPEDNTKIPVRYARSRVFGTAAVLRPVDKTAADVIGEPTLQQTLGDSDDCPACGKTFRNRSALKLHYEERHLQD